MPLYEWKRRRAARAAVLGLGIALPLAVLPTPAHAQSVLTLEKSHVGNFARGGHSVYQITVTNSSSEDSGELTIVDNFPAGLTVAGLGGDIAGFCDGTNN